MEDRSTLTQARDLRRHLTRAEARLWTALRRKQLGRLKFRRQHPLGPYILDFFCVSARLVVELDGGAHRDDAAQDHDGRRDQWISQQSLRILRIPNELVLDDLDEALRRIERTALRGSSG
jgi:very-short-patch-repair endonuclease